MNLNRLRTPAACLLVLAVASGASALVFPFTEVFAENNAGWTNSSNAPMSFVGSGGADGSSYASTTFNFAGTTATSTPAIIRCQNTTNASNGAFFGDWVTNNVTTLSFDFRHDAPGDLDVFVRWTSLSAPAFPGIILFAPDAVAPGQWATVTMAIGPGSAFVPEPGATYAGIFPQVARMQFGVTPGSLAGQNLSVTFSIDNVRITPTPGAAALAGLVGVSCLRRRR